MKSLFTTILAMLALLAPGVTFADDLKDMEGTWTLAEAQANGEKVESEELKAVTVKMTGDRYEVTLKKESGSFKLDTASIPKAMDITPVEGPNAGTVIKAIYEITGDTMRVCYALGGGARPTEFATKQDSGLLLISYKREKK